MQRELRPWGAPGSAAARGARAVALPPIPRPQAELEDKEREHTRKKLRTDEMEGGGVAASLEAGKGVLAP